MRLVAGTIIAKNYVSYARVWARSFLAQHPGARVTVLLADRNDGYLDPAGEPFDLLEAESLGIPEFRRMAFRYDVMELSTAVKPAFLQRLFETGNEDVALYFDPDILVLGPVTSALEALQTSNVALTPHALSPIPVDGRRPSEAAFLVSGAYNLGFVGLHRSAESTRLLMWWRDRLVRGGASAPEKGLFTDQKWIDLVPAFFAGVEIVRDPCLNVAYWNLHERGEIRLAAGRYLVGARPISFFHFSGFLPTRPNLLSKHQDRYRLEELSRATRALFEEYAQAIGQEGYHATAGLPYAYGAFADGEPINRTWRATYSDAEKLGLSWGDPFQVGPGSFREWGLTRESAVVRVPPFVRKVWEARPDVRAVYPLGLAEQADSLVDWVRGPGAVGLGVGPATRAALDGGRPPIEPQGDCSPSPAKRPRPSLVPRALGFLLEDPPLLPEELEGYACPPGSTAFRRFERALGKPLYRRLRYKRWQFLYRNAPAPRRPGIAPVAPLANRPPSLGDENARITLTPVEAPFGVNLFGYLDTESGIGEVARCFVRMLEAEGVPLAPINIPQGWLRREDRTLERDATSTPFPLNLFFVNADQLPAVLSNRRPLLDGRRSVGYWFWELEEFPERFDAALRLVDEVWVASSFCQRSIGARSAKPVVRIPPQLSIEPRLASDRGRLGLRDDDFVFLFVFDAASLFRRKNPGAAISAFRRAFPRPGRELLLLKTTNARAAQVRALERLARGSRIRVLNGYSSREDLLALHAASDVCVSLHRSEGLGLTLLEAMAYAKPVIATAYGGCEDFLRPDAAMLVPYRRKQIRRSVGPYPAGAIWAEPDVGFAAVQMQLLAADRELAARVGGKGREVFAEWSDGAGAAAVRRLRHLAETLPTPG